MYIVKLKLKKIFALAPHAFDRPIEFWITEHNAFSTSIFKISRLQDCVSTMALEDFQSEIYWVLTYIIRI